MLNDRLSSTDGVSGDAAPRPFRGGCDKLECHNHRWKEVRLVCLAGNLDDPWTRPAALLQGLALWNTARSQLKRLAHTPIEQHLHEAAPQVRS